MQKAFSNDEGIFQQDLAPCHCSKKVKVLSDNNFAVFKWPGDSPDLNPIENLWAIIKKELHKYDCTTTNTTICLSQLIRMVLYISNSYTLALFLNMCKVLL